MKKQLCKVLSALALCGCGYAAADALTQADQKLVEMAALLHEQALACGYRPADAVRTAQLKQRQVMLEQGVAAHAYDHSYAQAQRTFSQQWAKRTAQEQKAQCDQVKK